MRASLTVPERNGAPVLRRCAVAVEAVTEMRGPRRNDGPPLPAHRSAEPKVRRRNRFRLRDVDASSAA
jgi:CBS-domain-containing membrane protein